jgi:transposase-like protein
MAPTDNAIAANVLLEPGEHYSYREVARRFTVSYTTLTWRHKGHQESREAKDTSQLALSSQQEAELVRYIEDLTNRALPPTRAMIKTKSPRTSTPTAS